MSSGMVNCQKCGELNQYARWVKGEFKRYEELYCKKCGFKIYDKEKTYLEIQEEELAAKDNKKFKAFKIFRREILKRMAELRKAFNKGRS